MAACARYTDATSQWTLDYPPLFAWFEWALAQVARGVDPGMVGLQAAPYSSRRTELFMRLSVTASDCALLAAVLWFCGCALALSLCSCGVALICWDRHPKNR